MRSFDGVFFRQIDKQNLSLVMIDVDHFKEINDNFGHVLGDRILIRVSEIIKNKVRTIDLFARYGGDEFMILSPETNSEEAINLAEGLKVLLEKEIFPEVENVSCSFGVTQLKERDTIDSLIRRVDQGLYKAKESRDTVYFL